MSANIAGIYGAQIFQAKDKPLYRNGFTIACAVLSVGLVLAAIRYIDDLRRKRRSRIEERSIASDSDSNADAGLSDKK